MKKEYIYIGIAALGLYLWNKSKNSKIVLTLKQIQTLSIADLGNLKVSIMTSPSKYASPDAYLTMINNEIASRTATGTTTNVATVPVVTTAPLKPVVSTGVMNPSI